MLNIILFIIAWLLIVGFFHAFKPLPKNIGHTSKVYSIPNDSIHFLRDITFLNKKGKRESKQEIFNAISEMIRGAQYYILIDMFLFNDYLGSVPNSHRKVSKELTEILIAKKKENPQIIIQLITDPVNTLYGGDVSKNLEKLSAAGVSVIVTDLTKLRDSNFIYSPLWRTFIRFFGNRPVGGFLPHIMDKRKSKITLRSYLAILNFKANHRKIVVADYSSHGKCRYATLVTSSNPHDGSSAHSNTAIKIDQDIWRDVILTESAAANLSNKKFINPKSEKNLQQDLKKSKSQVQVLTERAIKEKLLEEINNLKKGDKLDMLMFYISDRDIVRSLKKADLRGVKLRFIFDPNDNAFGRNRNGIPNRQVARELMKNSNGNTQVRWYNAHGEQCHSKLILIYSNERISMMQGSANLTRRNIGNYNLETNVFLSGIGDEPYMQEGKTFFSKQWSNENNIIYTLDYDKYEDNNLLRVVLYHVMEKTGFSSF